MRYVDWLCSNMKPIVYEFSQRSFQRKKLPFVPPTMTITLTIRSVGLRYKEIRGSLLT